MRKVKISLKKLSACLCFLASGFVFAAKPKQEQVMPDWVSRPASVYPSDSYITHVGEGADRDSAEIKALQGVASVFGQSVQSDSTASQRMIQAKSEGKVATTNVNAFSQNVSRKVDVGNLIGVEIKEFWFDGANSWYAIAVLDKDKAAEIYGDMIRKNASAVNLILQNNAADKNSFEGYAAYDFAEDIAVENENHLKKIGVVKPEAAAALKAYCPASKDFRAKKLEVAKSIPICVKVENDDGGKIFSAFGETLSSLGFRGTDDDSARYTLYASAEFERTDSSDGKTVRCRYNVSGYILDSDSNQRVAPFTASGREGHINYDEAKIRAVRAVDAKIRKDFKESFSDYLKSI